MTNEDITKGFDEIRQLLREMAQESAQRSKAIDQRFEATERLIREMAQENERRDQEADRRAQEADRRAQEAAQRSKEIDQRFEDIAHLRTSPSSLRRPGNKSKNSRIFSQTNGADSLKHSLNRESSHSSNKEALTSKSVNRVPRVSGRASTWKLTSY